jgi:hypothetical protein
MVACLSYMDGRRRAIEARGREVGHARGRRRLRRRQNNRVLAIEDSRHNEEPAAEYSITE